MFLSNLYVSVCSARRDDTDDIGQPICGLMTNDVFKRYYNNDRGPQRASVYDIMH